MSKNREPELTPIITSQSNPIYIDSESTPHQGKYLNTVASISRLPAFDKNDNLTNLLYSKFIVKGVRPINYEAIVQKIRRNSDAKTERKVTR